jgi:hypothetical protein
MIKFYIPKGVLRRASVRFRASVPLQGMRKEDGFITKVDEAKSGEIIVLAKNVHFEDIDLLKKKNIKFIFDICDDKWNKDPELYNYACKNANLITTTCELLQTKIKEYTGKTAFIIPDPTEREQEMPKFEPKKHIKFAWFGGRKSFSLFDWDNVINDIRKVTNNFSIHAVTNKPEKASKRLNHLLNSKIMNMYHWSFEKQGQIVRECDIVLIPLPKDMPLVQVKSPNRVIDGIQQGRFVLTNDGVDSYKNLSDYIHLGSLKEGLKWALNNRDQVIEKIKQGQIYINKNHSPEIIGQRWIETEKLV